MSEQHLLGSGADGQFLGDFRALADATAMGGEAKYGRLVLQRLALFLVGHAASSGGGGGRVSSVGGGGRNRDTPLFELCHLVNILNAAGGGTAARAARWQFFLGSERVSAAQCRAELEQTEWPGTGFHQTEDGVAVTYGEEAFLVTYGRMPFLVALYEFLASMDGFAFHNALNDKLDEMLADLSSSGQRMRAIQDGANGLAAAMRQYRGRHLEQGMHDDAFMAILNYLRQQGDGRNLNFADDDILQFWCRHNTGEFRTYRRAFQRFAEFTAAMATTQARRSGETAAPLGSDWERGEVEPDDLNHDPGTLGNMAAWSDPLVLLDSGPASAIKFFTGSGEREPLAPLSAFGPFARNLPLAFLRYLAFGSVQDAITTALQFHPGRAVEADLLACHRAETYSDRRALYEKLHGHLDRLTKAVYHALSHGDVDGGNVVSLGGPDVLFDAARRQLDQNEAPSDEQLAALEAVAAKAFKQIVRRGFEDEALGRADRQEGFRVGAGVLYAVGRILDGYLDDLLRLEQKNGVDGGLDARFTEDVGIFAAEFEKLYGVSDDRDRNAR